MRVVAVTLREAAEKENMFAAFFRKENPLEKEGVFSFFPEETKKSIALFCRKWFRGEEGEIKSLWLEKPEKRAVFFGLGERDKWNERKEKLLARRFAQYAKNEKIAEFAASSAKISGNEEEKAEIFSVNALMADFEFNRYKEKPEEGWPQVKTIYLAAGEKSLSEAEKGVKKGTIAGEETNLCREITNTPGGDMTPARLAEAAKVAAKRTGLQIKILAEGEMKKLGMGGILGVGRGSKEKPRMIILEHRAGPSGQTPLVLIGKGITFDTGGLNLKSGDAINEMHMDMSGGGAVIHGMAAMARLSSPVNAVGIIPAAENMPSGSSYRPGDILKTMSGKTIEVLNTDAEGRIVLADALFYGTKYGPGLMADFATLTGAAQVALGSFASALFTNIPLLEKELVRIGEISGDYVWPMPLWDEYKENIRGTFGDIANSGKRDAGGGAINGAKFLEQFVGKTPWLHIDIAPRMTANDSEFLAKGASGVGVRYIAKLAEKYTELTAKTGK